MLASLLLASVFEVALIREEVESTQKATIYALAAAKYAGRVPWLQLH